ncbi:hypothetical protein [Verrucomicrobium spinosum]|uniref:hypothetical protein n=1 Tax=Verrucomicrobium spinosum TaxID=2736 RepID=UPI000492A829|nr:hypothetical protein [Verrucomicrobium spinosum]
MTNIYPRYSKNLLEVMVDDYLDDVEAYLARTGRAEYRLRKSFQMENLQGDELSRMRNRKVCCMSLFFKPAKQEQIKNSPQRSSSGEIIEEELHKVRHPAFQGSPRYESSFWSSYLEKILNSDFADWVPVAFLARDLGFLRDSLKERGWIVVQMRHDSVAHNPGAMWRYLGFNFDARCCYFQDTDRSFSSARADRMANLLTLSPRVALARPLQWSNHGEMSVILGNDFAVNPSQVPFDSAKMMLGYILLSILHEDRLNNFCFEPVRKRNLEKVAPLSARHLREHFGPLHHERVGGKCYPYYTFDEQWLKEFVYYQMTEGRMATLLLDRVKEGDEVQAADIAFQREHGNLLVSTEPKGGSSDAIGGLGLPSKPARSRGMSLVGRRTPA